MLFRSGKKNNRAGSGAARAGGGMGRPMRLSHAETEVVNADDGPPPVSGGEGAEGIWPQVEDPTARSRPYPFARRRPFPGGGDRWTAARGGGSPDLRRTALQGTPGSETRSRRVSVTARTQEARRCALEGTGDADSVKPSGGRTRSRTTAVLQGREGEIRGGPSFQMLRGVRGRRQHRRERPATAA